MNVRYLPSIHYKKNCFSKAMHTYFGTALAKICLPLGDQSKQITACRADCGQKKTHCTYFATGDPKTQGFPNWLMFFCLYVFVLVFCAFLFCYHICTFLFVFWHIFCLTWFQDLGIPKLVAVFSQAAPHKQQLVGTNIIWTGQQERSKQSNTIFVFCILYLYFGSKV